MSTQQDVFSIIADAKTQVARLEAQGRPGASRNDFDTFLERHVDHRAYTPEIISHGLQAAIKMIDQAESANVYANLEHAYYAVCRAAVTENLYKLTGQNNAAQTQGVAMGDTYTRLAGSWEPTNVGKHDRNLRKRTKELAQSVDAGLMTEAYAIQILSDQHASSVKTIAESRMSEKDIQQAQRDEIRREAQRREAEHQAKIRDALLRQRDVEEDRPKVIGGHVSEYQLDKNGFVVAAKFDQDKPAAPAPEARPQAVRHTLQVARFPADGFQDLGTTSFHSWLVSNGYDTTSAEARRQVWAEMGGWHIEAAKHVATGETHFWFVAFDGRGGRLVSKETQQNYISAWKHVVDKGITKAELYALSLGRMANLAYPHKAAEIAPAAQKFAAEAEAQEQQQAAEYEAKFATVEVRQNQAKFRKAVFANCGGKCVITGLEVILEAAHLTPWSEDGADTADNGLLMRVDIHRLFDLGLMAIHPDTMRAHFAPGIGYDLHEGTEITTRRPVNRAALVARWDTFLAKHFNGR